MVDHIAAPDTCGALTPSDLASVFSELAYNDPQWPHTVGDGTPLDRNVELIIATAA